MIKKFTLGTPVKTDSTVLALQSSAESIPFFTTSLSGDGSFSLKADLKKDDIVYGLGESVRGINKRGFIYESFCSDDPVHTESKHSLYGAHNFIIIDGEKHLGLFIDCPARVKYDIGFTDSDKLLISVQSENLDIYIIDGISVNDTVKQFRELIGRSYIPPFWAFGYQQSRWSYPDQKAVEAVLEGYKSSHIPLDAIYLDIDYMDSYKDFTVDSDKFPTFAAFASEMQAKGIHLVPIIDAGVKAENGYFLSDEGRKNNYFCKDAEGNDYVTAVWPGLTYFPDFLNSKARKWFGGKYKILTDMGIDGFWNDMNEPAIFYSEKGLKKAWDKVREYEYKELDINSFFEVRDIFANLSNSYDDYSSMFHNMDGLKLRHSDVHNMYGYFMTRAAGEVLDTICPGKRILLFSRASMIGMHRYGGIWTGDNQSWWSHLELSIKQMPSLNMCGFLYIGSDIGGFGADATEDLLLRWISFSVFTPLMRNHSALGTREQECYKFKSTAAFRSMINFRYRFLPYIYSEYISAAMENEMYFKPLAFDYPDDERAKTTDDQLLLGKSIMLAPVYKQNAPGRYVYLPEDMLAVKVKDDKITTEIFRQGDHFVAVDTDEIVFFIKKNHFVPMYKSAECTAELNKNEIELLGYVTDTAAYNLYEDDGYTKDISYDKLINITVQKGKNGFSVFCADSAKKILQNITGE